MAKLVHEQLAMQWLLPSSHGNQDLQQSAWFFFELMVKAMVEHLATTSRLGAPRKSRFSETFHNDVINLVSSITSDIVCRHKGNPDMFDRLNTSLAFFLHDLLSVMDRGFVFSELVKTYMRDVNSRMNSSSSESLSHWRLQVTKSRPTSKYFLLIFLQIFLQIRQISMLSIFSSNSSG